MKNRPLSRALFAITMAGAIGLGAPKPDPALHGIQLPLVFEPNHGQAAPGVRFLARGKDYTLLLRDEGAILRLPSSELRLRLAGSRRAKRLEALDPQPGTSSYFVGNNPAKWHSGIGQSGRVRYAEVYPGIDLVFKRDASSRLEYDFVVAPEADPSKIGVRLEGAQSIESDGDGGIVLHTASGEIRQPRPRIYQDFDSGRREVGGRMVLDKGNVIHFELGPYDHSCTLVIDPVVIGYIASSVDEEFSGIARDGAGNVYVAGYTISPDFPATHTLGAPAKSVYHVFINKYSSNLTTLYYSTVIGGNAKDYPTGIRVDSARNAYVVGNTFSTNFPTVNAAQSAFGVKIQTGIAVSDPLTDAFLLKLNPTGTTLIYSTFLGGNASDRAFAMTLDAAGAVYATGTTSTQHFPATPGAVRLGPEVTMMGNLPFVWNAVWVAKLSSEGGPFDYVAVFGGAAASGGTAIAVDSEGNAYVAGSVGTGVMEDFPIVGNVVQPKRGGSLCNTCSNGFVSKLNPTGTNLVFSTYFGGSVTDVINGVTLDSAGNTYIVGTTNSPDLPVTPGVLGPALLSGANTAFVAALNNSASAILACSYLGGSSGTSAGNAIAVRAPGVIGIAGGAQSGAFLGINNSLNLLGGLYVELDPLFGSVIRFYAPYPYALDYVSLALGADGSVAMGGTTQFLPGPNGYALMNRNGAVFLVDPPLTLTLTGSASPNAVTVGSNFSYTFTAENNGSTAATNLSLAASFSGSAVEITGASISSGSCASLPTPPTSASCTTPSLAPGAKTTVTFTGMAVGVGFGKAAASLASDDYNNEYALASMNVTGSGPQINTGGIVIHGGISPAISPGALVDIYGTGMAAATALAPAGPTLPTKVGGVQVLVNNIAAPLIYVSALQIIFQMPYETPLGTDSVVVVSDAAVSAAAPVTVQQAAPYILTYGTNRAVVVNPDGNVNGSNDGAKAGAILVAYLIGSGPLDNPIPTGAPALSSPLSREKLTTTATVGGSAATVQFAGMTPGFEGLMQLNFVLPNLVPGDYPLQVTIGGFKSNLPLVTVSK